MAKASTHAPLPRSLSAAQHRPRSLATYCLAALLYATILLVSWTLFRVGRWAARRAEGVRGSAQVASRRGPAETAGEEEATSAVGDEGAAWTVVADVPTSGATVARGALLRGQRPGPQRLYGTSPGVVAPAATASDVGKERAGDRERTSDVGASRTRTGRRWRPRCVLPVLPPVLFLLLTGIAARELAELYAYRCAVARLARLRHRRDGGEAGVWGPSAADMDAAALALPDPWDNQAATGGGSVHLVQELLSVSRPFLLLGLATVGVDIGSHLSLPVLARVKRPLVLFGMCFFPVLYGGMAVVFRVAGASLCRVQARAELWAAEEVRGSATNTTTATAAAASQRAELARALAAYHTTTLWCFGLVLACVTVERSSPEFINAMHSAGATGILPTFMLSVAACQDILALVLFVVVSSLVRPKETQTASAVVRALSRLLLPLRGGSHAATAIGERAAAAQDGAGAELLLIAVSTGGAAVMALAVRLLWRRAMRPRGVSAVSARVPVHGAVAGAAADPASAPPRSPHSPTPAGSPDTAGAATGAAREETGGGALAAFGLLALVTATLAAWSVLTPCELLLAAVVTGSGANFFTPCPLLQRAIASLSELTNVVLFTSMGMRTRFTSYDASSVVAEGQAGGSALHPSAALPLTATTTTPLWTVLLWGVLFFLARLLLCWTGGFLGATAASVQRLANEYASLDSPGERVLPADEEGAHGAKEAVAATAAAGTHRTVTGVRNWIGLATITQLAIALTLNNRAGEEYRTRVADPLTRLAQEAFSDVPHAALAKTAAANRLLSLLSATAANFPLPMAPLVQAYTISIALAMLSGPVLGAWVLRKASPPRTL